MASKQTSKHTIKNYANFEGYLLQKASTKQSSLLDDIIFSNVIEYAKQHTVDGGKTTGELYKKVKRKHKTHQYTVALDENGEDILLIPKKEGEKVYFTIHILGLST